MSLGPAANPADTHFLPRPEWYYRSAFQGLKYLSGRASLLGILLPGLLAVLFAAVPFLDRGRERRPWRRPVVITCFVLFLIGYISLGVASYRDDYSTPAMAAQMNKQEADVETFMKQPFVPETAPAALPKGVVSAASAASPIASAPVPTAAAAVNAPASPTSIAAVAATPGAVAPSASAASAAADPLVAKGQALFAAGPCSACHGDHGEGTAAAVALIGVGAKYSQAQILTILRNPTPAMTDGGMQPVDLNDADLAALAKYLRQLH